MKSFSHFFMWSSLVYSAQCMMHEDLAKEKYGYDKKKPTRQIQFISHQCPEESSVQQMLIWSGCLMATSQLRTVHPCYNMHVVATKAAIKLHYLQGIIIILLFLIFKILSRANLLPLLYYFFTWGPIPKSINSCLNSGHFGI